MVKEKLLTKEEAVARITSEDIERLFYPQLDAKAAKTATKIATGINAVPGAASGKVVFTAAEAEEMAELNEKVLLVRKETSPEDVGGMHAAIGILTATGGKTSHAAVVARGWGKCCVVGCEALNINYETKSMTGRRQSYQAGRIPHSRRQYRRCLSRPVGSAIARTARRLSGHHEILR